MIICSNCESAQFLQITRSRVYFDDGESVDEIEEDYECQLCGSTGKYRFEDGGGYEAVTGEIDLTKEKQRFA